MPAEKTWPVSIGEEERRLLLEIIAFTQKQIGYEVTQRAVVSRAIKMMHETLMPEEKPEGA